MLLRAILTGGVWNGFLLSKVKKEDINCRFCNAPDNDGHLFLDCTFPPFVELRNNPEFLPLRAEYWGVILALQAYSRIHIGIDNLYVLRGVAALLSQEVTRTPLSFVKDGDLLATIHSML